MGTGYGDLDGDIEVVTIPNQKVYQALESDLFEQFSGWNGVSGWQSDTAQGLIDLEGDQAASLAAQTALHPFIAYGRPEFGVTEFQKLDDADIGGRAHHVVRIGGRDWTSTFSSTQRPGWSRGCSSTRWCRKWARSPSPPTRQDTKSTTA